MKSYTDKEQSRRLAKILPIESADMIYLYWINSKTKNEGIDIIPTIREGIPIESCDIPCWSLAALLCVLSYPSLHKTFSGWRCDSYNKEGTPCILGEPKENPIDACVETIIHLHELNLL